MKSMQRELAVATDLVLEAGALVMSWRGRAASETKEGGEPVTVADREANDLLVTGLSRAFPDDGILAEETATGRSVTGAPRTWCVDPIDGTREFIDGSDEFAVMVGLAVHGRAELGIIMVPAKEVLYWGGPRIGAFKRRFAGGSARTLRVSAGSELSEMSVAVSRSHRPAALGELTSRLGLTRVVSCGSVGVKAGLVADASVDCYVHPASGTRLWDACAPEALVAGAGGLLTDCRGQAIDYDSADVVNRAGLIASNGTRHAEIIRESRTVLPPEDSST